MNYYCIHGDILSLGEREILLNISRVDGGRVRPVQSQEWKVGMEYQKAYKKGYLQRSRIFVTTSFCPQSLVVYSVLFSV